MKLHTVRSGGDGPLVLLVHGITASHMSWPRVAGAVLGRRPDAALLAVDLRGRGESDRLGGPYGIAQHVEDLLTVLGDASAVLVGHSMGAWIVARLAAEQPDRAAAVVLVDGGVSGPLPPEAVADPDAALDRILGPSIARLRMTFASEDDYIAFWRSHPAFAEGRFNEDVADYARFDLVGEPPHLHSRVSEEAVRTDGRDLLLDEATRGAADRIQAPVHLLRASHGLLHEQPPFLDAEVVAAWAARTPHARVTELEGINHHTIVLGDGAAATADVIAAALSPA